MKKEKEQLITPIVSKTTFKFSREENFRNVAVSLALGGYFVKGRIVNGFFELQVYDSQQPDPPSCS